MVVLAVMDGSRRLDPELARAFNDAARLAAGLTAALACWATWRRAVDPDGRWRLLLFLALAGWSSGTAVWAVSRLLGSAAPLAPVAADAGLFVLPALAVPALWSLPSHALDEPEPVSHRSLTVLALDGLLVVGSLFVLIWATALGTIMDAERTDRTVFLVPVAHPTRTCCSSSSSC